MVFLVVGVEVHGHAGTTIQRQGCPGPKWAAVVPWLPASLRRHLVEGAWFDEMFD